MDSIYAKQARIADEIFQNALNWMKPANRIREWVRLEGNRLTVGEQSFELGPKRRVRVVGAGKATQGMARALEQEIGKYLADGLIIVPRGTATQKRKGIIQEFEADHPLPTRDSLAAGYELIKFAERIPKNDIVLFALSGGASSLLEVPATPLEIEDISEAYDLLIRSGADIHQINTVRKHLSSVKGGKLLSYLPVDNLIDLVVSDVPDDRLESIGSGPTIPDTTTYTDAFHILKNFKLWDRISHDIRKHIAKGMHGEISRKPKPETRTPFRHKSYIIASASKLSEKVEELAGQAGYNVYRNEEAYSAGVREIARKITGKAISILSRNDPVAKPAALVYYGESTVHVKGDGLGGRNQELALSACLSIEGQHHITLLSGGTDGRDGPTDAAGAICNAQTALEARRHNIEPETYLQNNDSYHFFEKMSGLLKTGPTGNNLMDLQIVLIEK